jgi:Outer membrane protein beta-barrel family
MNMTMHNNNLRFGGDYYINKTTTIGFLTTGSIGDWSSRTNSNATISGFNANPYDRMKTNSFVADNWTNGSANINFKHSFKKGELTADADYSNWKRTGTQDIPNRFFKGDTEVLTSSLQNGAATSTEIIIKALKIDYTLPVSNTLNLEMGAKMGFVNTDNTLFATLKQDEKWIDDPSRTNKFTYQENINAAYLNASKKIGKQWSLQAGLRLENTSFEGYSVTLNKRNKQDYLSLFPSFNVSYTPTDKHKISASYSRRIDRPTYSNLNPFIMYLDKYTYNKGNEFLNPQFTNTVGMAYGYNNFLFLTLNYSRTDNSMSQILGIDLEKQATYQTMANLSLTENYSANLSAPIPVAKWWLMNLNLTSFYNRNELQQNKVLTQLSFQSNVTNIFTLPAGFKFEVMGFYQSPTIFAVFEMEQQYKVDLGISKSFLNNQFRFKASFTDLFNTFQFKAKTEQPNLNNQVLAKWETQIFRVNLTYVFGNKDMKAARRRNTASDDLQERANQGGGN